MAILEQVHSHLGRTKERSLNAKSIISHDKDINTLISVRPDVQMWPAYSFSSPRQMVWGNDTYMDTTHDNLSWKERKNNGYNKNEVLNHIDAQVGHKTVPKNGFDYVTSDVMNMATDKNEQIPAASRNSVSPSTASVGSPELSTQHSPSQVIPQVDSQFGLPSVT